MLNPLMASLAQASQQASPQATAALSRAIASLHQYLDLEHDPQKRTIATGCLARLETLRKDHLTPQNSSGGGAGQPSAPQGPPGY